MDMKKLKKWKAFQATKPVPDSPTTEIGKKMYALKVGETILIPWMDDRRPSGPGEIMLHGRHWKIEPQEAGTLWTRIG